MTFPVCVRENDAELRQARAAHNQPKHTGWSPKTTRERKTANDKARAGVSRPRACAALIFGYVCVFVLRGGGQRVDLRKCRETAADEGKRGGEGRDGESR